MKLETTGPLFEGGQGIGELEQHTNNLCFLLT